MSETRRGHHGLVSGLEYGVLQSITGRLGKMLVSWHVARVIGITSGSRFDGHFVRAELEI